MSYSTETIRNVCLLGHSGSGKTALAESMLFATGAIDRMGRVPDGNTVCDYDAEEILSLIHIWVETVRGVGYRLEGRP